jgi:phage baseplate assembly protein W|tara:strand:- start:600 stop:974 length:375 start_codon:yes stop_codon:yes gene_type:complete
MIKYRGFSTAQNAKRYTLTDYQLAKQDLINHFRIRKGQKLMNPTFGCIIWDMLFEPLDESTQQIITEDINKIANYDPRLRVQQVAVTQEQHGFLIQLSMYYVPNGQTETLSLNFDRTTSSLIVN